jgi:two-component system, cell cycle response regulator
MAARILIVEDNPANLQLMVYLLKSFGYLPWVAHDGEEALELIRREPLDLIICDLQLPKVDGFEVAGYLKNNPVLSKIPLVAVTAFAMVGDRDKILAAGFDGYISKPIAPQTFVRQVEAFISAELHGLPLPRAAVTNTTRIPFAQGDGGTVLVVDDLRVNIKLMRSILESAGYRVLAAEGVQKALQLAKETKPDLIVADVHMRGKNGYELIKAVKADPHLNVVPFIFISSSGQQEKTARDGLALGASKFLFRPIEPQALLDEIKVCLGERKTV